MEPLTKDREWICPCHDIHNNEDEQYCWMCGEERQWTCRFCQDRNIPTSEKRCDKCGKTRKARDDKIIKEHLNLNENEITMEELETIIKNLKPENHQAPTKYQWKYSKTK